jgi:hypothetical protein
LKNTSVYKPFQSTYNIQTKYINKSLSIFKNIVCKYCVNLILSIPLYFNIMLGRQSNKITCLIFFISPHFLTQPLLISALK